MRESKLEKRLEHLKVFILFCFSIACLFPLLWLLLSSFKTNETIYSNPWGLPAAFNFDNYIYAITRGNVFVYFGNSAFIATIAVLTGIILCSMASYAIVRMEWKYSKLVLRVFLVGMTVPIYAMIVPLFSLFGQLGLLNSRFSVIIAHVGIAHPIGIFIMTGFMQGIPREIEEAAVIDGCNIFQLFYHVITPVIKSSMVTIAVIMFMSVWNDLLLPQIFLTDPLKMTLPVGLTEFQGQYETNYTPMIAAVVMAIIPSVIVYALLHRNIMEGLVAGAVKG